MMNDPLQKKPKNAGFSVGFAAGLVMIFVSLSVFFMNGAEPRGDTLVWLIQLAVYVFAGRMAANRQAEAARLTYEPTSGVMGAGVGAALVVSVMMWIFIIVRGLTRDALGMTVTIEPVSFCGWIILDVLLAIGIGSLSGRAILKQYQPNPYDTSNF